MLVRLGRPQEWADLVDLQRAASLANPGDREMLLAHPEVIDFPVEQIEAGQVFVAEWEGSLAGFSSVLDRDDGDTELDGLFVRPDIWKGGIGRALVDAASAYARAHGARHLHVVGNPAAEQFYLRVGFVETGRVQMQFGEGLLMKLPL